MARWSRPSALNATAPCAQYYYAPHSDMLASVTTAKKAAKKPAKKRTFAEIGRAAARAAQREALLAALEKHGWSLTRAGEALGMLQPAVVRALKDLAPEEYEKAKTDGRIVPGIRKTS